MPGKDILVLEDDEGVAQLIKFLLEEEGWAVRLATDVHAFWRMVAERRPDLISMDILLPDGDGFKVFETLAKTPETRDIPVVFITVRESDKEKGIQMGAVGYLAKPFAHKDLKTTIAEILKSRS